MISNSRDLRKIQSFAQIATHSVAPLDVSPNTEKNWLNTITFLASVICAKNVCSADSCMIFLQLHLCYIQSLPCELEH